MHRHRRTLQTKGIAIMARITHRSVLVTGGNRGIGGVLVEEALRRGASRVYVDTRGSLAHADGRVTPLTLEARAWRLRKELSRGSSLSPHTTAATQMSTSPTPPAPPPPPPPPPPAPPLQVAPGAHVAELSTPTIHGAG
jgi:hypothetical protein